jgi:glc operon protein GlcG
VSLSARRLVPLVLLAQLAFVGLVIAAAGAAGAEPALPSKPYLTLAAARRVAAAAEAEAARRGLGVVVAVVDEGGVLLVLERLDAAQVASVDVAIAKARTAAIFRRPSRVFEEQVKNGRVSALALPGAAALQGGLPLEYGGRVVGAIGVSGDAPQVDEDIAAVGVAALAK